MLRAATLLRSALLGAIASTTLWATASATDAPLRWFRDGHPTPQALALLAQIGGAGEHGLVAADYDAATLAQRVAGMTAGAARVPDEHQAEVDRALSAAALHYGNDLHRGRIDPHAAGLALRAHPALDEAAFLASLSASADVAATLRALEPDFLHYRLLEQWLQRYRELAVSGDSLTRLPAPTTRSVRVGEPYAGAAALRTLLTALGDLPAAPVGSSDAVSAGSSDATLDEALSAALARYQERNGLTPDGQLGRRTYESLTTPLAQRVRQIELTLERWRWVPSFDRPPIIINIPQFRLFAFRRLEDRAADIQQMPVIVGQAFRNKRTPVFVAELQQVVFQPYWDVPPSILRNELLEPLRKDPAGYLARNDMELVSGPGDDSPVVPPSAENIAALAAGKLRLRQRAGARNSLGPVKFVFPNDYGVYLHGTPAQRLFAQSRRDFSHGCIRLSDPAALAVHVLRSTDGGHWTAEAVNEAMNGAPNQRVRVAQPIPVMVLYGTALAKEDGHILFFDDVYGHDRRLEQLLARRVRAAN
jgi:murein L,D-transpeptidase YcbB/YkuD